MTQQVATWSARVNTAGGGFEWNSIGIANQFIRAIKDKSYFNKIVYLLPMLGRGINAARIPLIDQLNAGGATNVSFVDADFNQSTGLQGNGTTKYLNTLIKPSQLGSSSNGGLGYWENNITFGGNSEAMGTYNSAGDQRYVIDLRVGHRFFSWGSPSNAADRATGAINGHYYGIRSSATRRDLYLNGSFDVSSVVNDTASGVANQVIFIVGALEVAGVTPTPAPWPGRCALAYMTDGTFTANEIYDFDSIIRAYLMGPTGKPQT